MLVLQYTHTRHVVQEFINWPLTIVFVFRLLPLLLWRLRTFISFLVDSMTDRPARLFSKYMAHGKNNSSTFWLFSLWWCDPCVLCVFFMHRAHEPKLQAYIQSILVWISGRIDLLRVIFNGIIIFSFRWFQKNECRHAHYALHIFISNTKKRIEKKNIGYDK